MKIKDLAILNIAKTFRSQGATQWIDLDFHPSDGFVVALQDYETIVEVWEGLTNRNIEDEWEKKFKTSLEVQENSSLKVGIGTWEYRNKVYLDVVIWVQDESDAENLAILNKQESIFDIAREEVNFVMNQDLWDINHPKNQTT